MSTWFDQSNNANKLRQSYLKGFLDISGGGILVRSDNSLNFYSGEGATPNFALDATKLRVPNITAASGSRKLNSTVTNVDPQVSGAVTGQHVDISSAQLSYLYGLNENVQATIDEFHSYKTAQSSSATIANLNSTNANITSDATIGGRLYVGGDTTMRGNLSVNKDLYVGGNVIVAGSQTVNMDFYVKGNTHLDGDVFIGKELRVFNANLYVEKNITASGELISTGNTFIKKNMDICGNTVMAGTLTLGGDASFNSNLRVAGTIFCDKIVIGTDLSDNGTMHIGQKLTASAGIDLTGDASFNSKLFVAGDASLNSKLFVSDAATLNSTLEVRSDASLNTTLKVGGATTLNGTLEVRSDASLNTALKVGGATTLRSTLDVDDASILKSTLEVRADASLNTALKVGGATTLRSTLAVDGVSTLANNLFVTTGDVSLNQKLYVAGDVSLNAHVSARDISSGILQTGRLIIEDNYSNNANVPNTIRTTAGNIRISPNLATDWTVITSNLQVDGSINFTGAMVRTDTIVKVTEAFDVSNSGTRTALVVSQYAPSQNIASFDRGDESDPVFTVGRDNSVGINITGNLNANWHLDVSGATRISKDLQVNGDVSFTKELSVSGNVLISKDLTVTKKVGIAETLDVSGASVFHSTAEIKGNVLLRSHLKMDASKFIDQIGGETW
jgi:predicted acyltransferase (DUF342 family)